MHDIHKSKLVGRLSSLPLSVGISILVTSIAVAGCGGGSSSSTTPPPQSVSVSVSTSSSSVLLGNTLQFNATVMGTSNTAVSWSVNNVGGGNSTVGTISNSGLYTAPSDLPSPASVTIAATSQADTTKSSHISVSVTSDIAITVTTSPSNAQLVPARGIVQLTAGISSNGHPDMAVNWSVNGVANGNSTLGTITAAGTDTATYTAPALAPSSGSIQITAESVADPSKMGAAALTMTTLRVSVTPSSSSILLGDSQQFSATVSGAIDTNVNWSVNGIDGGNSSIGTISSSGLYTAPGDLPNPVTVNIAATSQALSSARGSAAVTIISDISISIATTPANIFSVATGTGLQLTAAISSAGTPDPNVNWSVNGVSGGNSTVGTIAAKGSNTALYIAPATVPNPYTVSISATSLADPTKTASDPIIVAGTIETVTQNVTAAQGATVTLPSGSSVKIPAGVLMSDQSVTLSLVSALPQQPPDQIISGVGPALVLSLSIPNPKAITGALKAATAPTAHALSPTDIQFTINTSGNTASGLQGSAPIADAVDTSGNHNFVGAVSGAYDATANIAKVAVSSSMLSKVSSLAASMANWVTGAMPTLGPRIFDGTKWAPFSSPCPPGPKVLVLVHGMTSTVEGAYSVNGNTCAGGMQSSGNYNSVVGYNYTWRQDIDASGKLLATFLDQVAHCPNVTQVDIEAHSEGVPVAVSAITRTTQLTQQSISHFIPVAGPITGTPIATSVGAVLLTVLLNLTGSSIPAGSNLQDIGSAGFVVGMTPNNSEEATNLANFAALQKAGTLPAQVITVAGTNASWSKDPLVNLLISPLFTEPYDNIIGMSSAEGINSGLQNLRNLPTYELDHTHLTCDPLVIQQVGQALQNLPVTCTPQQQVDWNTACYNAYQNQLIYCSSLPTQTQQLQCVNAAIATYQACYGSCH